MCWICLQQVSVPTAKYFLGKGWNVAATMRSPIKAGEWTTAENVICPRFDVTLPKTIENAVRETIERFRQIDVLVNNTIRAPISNQCLWLSSHDSNSAANSASTW